MSSAGSCPSTCGEKHGSVLLIHWNQRIAKFLDGVLRNAFKVRSSGESAEALGHLREDPPDAILCDADCLTDDSDEILRVLETNDGCPEIPLILLLRERCEDFAHTRKLLSKAADCVSLSINPTLLKWKVMNLITLKREMARLRTNELEALQGAKRFECLAQMAVHDLKLPVAAMKGLLGSLRSRLDAASVKLDTTHILDKAFSSCQFVDAVLTDMHELLSSDQASNMRDPIRWDEIAFEVIEQHKASMENNEVDIQLHAEKDLPETLGNRNRIKQVFDNLLTNALRHMGSVVNPTISITIADRGDLLTTTVSDNGVGIPAEFRETIFEPSIRGPAAVDGNGSGLGLSIVKQIVNRHSGEIWMDTESGQGTKFIFTLPKSSTTG